MQRGWTGLLARAFQPSPEIVSRSQYLIARLDLRMHLVGLIPGWHSVFVAYDPRVALTPRSPRHEVARRAIQHCRDRAVRCALPKAIELLGDCVYRLCGNCFCLRHGWPPGGELGERISTQAHRLDGAAWTQNVA